MGVLLTSKTQMAALFIHNFVEEEKDNIHMFMCAYSCIYHISKLVNIVAFKKKDSYSVFEFIGTFIRICKSVIELKCNLKRQEVKPEIKLAFRLFDLYDLGISFI